MADGKTLADDVELHIQLTGNIRRCYEALGLDRVPRPVDGPMTLGAVSGRPCDGVRAS